MDPGDSLFLINAITAALWWAHDLNNKPVWKQVWQKTFYLKKTLVLVRHWHCYTSHRCLISFFFFLSHCCLWVCNFWREAIEASNVRIVRPSAAVVQMNSNWNVCECALDLFREHPRRKFDQFVKQCGQYYMLDHSFSGLFTLMCFIKDGANKRDIVTV